MKHLALRPAAALVACLLAGTSHASLLVNGGFEAPALAAGAFTNFGPGGEPSGFAWQVGSGDIDLGALPVNPFVQFAAFEGSQAIDLNGNQRGDVFQDFATVAGQKYRLRFAYADNPVEGGISSADVTVTDIISTSALLSGSISHSTSTNGPPASGDWTTFSASFIATGSSTRLRFTSTSASNSPSGGVLLDGVSVDREVRTDVPAPTGVGIAAAAAMLLAHRRRRRA